MIVGSRFPLSALGKYLTPSSALAVLKNRTLRWSRPGLFNDPFDSKIFPKFCPPIDEIYGPSLNEFRRVLRNEVNSLSVINEVSRLLSQMRAGLEQGGASLEDYESHFRQFLEEFLQNQDQFSRRYFDEVVQNLVDLKILCLTKSFADDTMWAHYADNFQGALFIFAPSHSESIFTRAEEVRYSDEPYHIFDVDEFSRVITGQLSMSDDAFTAQAIKKIILSKKVSWAYEKEWRINFGAGRQPLSAIEYLPFDPTDLRSVIFGLRADKKFIEETCELASKVNGEVTFFTSIIPPGTSQIDYIELTK